MTQPQIQKGAHKVGTKPLSALKQPLASPLAACSWEDAQSAIHAGVPIMIGDGEPVMRLTITAPGVDWQAEVLLGPGQHIEIDSDPIPAPESRS